MGQSASTDVNTQRSFSPATPGPTTTLPSLPPELLTYIIQLSLPEPLTRTSTERQLLLRNKSLVSHSFRVIVQRLLLEDVYLPTYEQADLFTMYAGKLDGNGSVLGEKVRTMRLVGKVWWNETAGASSRMLEKLLKVCPRCEELWVATFSHLEVGAFGCGQNLKRLYLAELRLCPSPPPLHQFILPHLSHLYLKANIFTANSLVHLLSPTTLPSLTSLDYLSVHETPVPPSPPFLSIAPQLVKLSLGDYATRRPSYESLKICENVRILNIRMVGNDNTDLATDHLPPSLDHLRLRLPPSIELAPQEWRKVCEKLLEHPSLKSVTLPERLDWSLLAKGKFLMRGEKDWMRKEGGRGLPILDDTSFELEWKAWSDFVVSEEREHCG